VSRRLDLSVETWTVRYAMGLVTNGGLGLPDFQRRFEWTASDVKAYLSTVLAGLPSGTLMIAENFSLQVLLRELEGAPKLFSEALDVRVLLDGQQRLTSLYQALYDVGPDRYAVDFTALTQGAELLQDNVVIASSARQWDQYYAQAAGAGRVLVPFSALATSSDFFGWLHSIERPRWPNMISDEALGRIFADHVHPMETYKIPVTSLGGKLDLSTIAQVFERTNKWGQRLDAFDLLVARLQGGGWSLRHAWDEARQEYPEIARVFGDNGLCTVSAISLLHRSDIRRSAVLSLPPKEVAKYWTEAVEATRDVARLLLSEGVRKPDLLPYEAVAITMIAARMVGASPSKLIQYFWMCGANRRYEVASNTTAVADFRQIETDGQLFEEWNLTVDVVERNTRRSSKALWATLVAVMLAQDPLDLLTGERVSSPAPEAQERWYLTSLAKGGHSVETANDTPARLRTAGQLFWLPGRSGGPRQSNSLIRVIRRRVESPELFGPSIEDCLESQVMPNSNVLLGGASPREIIESRASSLYALLMRRALVN
jgi:hypothetical protein